MPQALSNQLLNNDLRRRLARNPLRWIVRPGDARIVPFAYTPKQHECFANLVNDDGTPVKLFGAIGGNRSGKTEWAVRWLIGGALGIDPRTMHARTNDPKEWELGPPRLFWCVTTTYEKSREVQQRYLWERMPRALMRSSFHESSGFHNNVAVLKNGSRIVFKSEEQDLVTFEGNPVHGAWIDETISLPYVRATIVRTADFRGQVVWTTWPNDPVLGDVFMDGRLDVNATDGLGPRDIRAVWLAMADNPHMSPEEIARQAAMMPAHERQARIFGVMSRGDVLVYADYRDVLHRESRDLPVPSDWTLYEAIDPGWDNPFAVAFVGVDQWGVQHVYDELYERRRTNAEMAALIYLRRWQSRGLMTPREIEEFSQAAGLSDDPEDRPADAVEQALERNRRLKAVIDLWRRRKGDCRPRWTVIDPAAAQTDSGKPASTARQLEALGIQTRPARNTQEARAAQRNAVRELLRPIDGRVRLKIDWRCRWMHYELTHFRKAEMDARTGQYLGDREKVIDAHNHLCAALEYLQETRPSWVPGAGAVAPAGSPLGRAAEREVQERSRAAVPIRNRG